MRLPACFTVVLALLAAVSVSAQPQLPAWDELPEAAQWELRMLGVTGPERLAELRATAAKRVVTLAIVGQSGISKSKIRPYLPAGSSFAYRSCPDYPNCEPGKSTHDTGQARVILDLTAALGIRVRLASYRPDGAWQSVARDMADAGGRCDIVVCFQSFWGENVSMITEAIAASPRALFVAPYAEYEKRPTATCMQAASTKPGGGGLANFITCAPLARKSDGSILQPANRDANDTEIINFIAPSYHAGGRGGTCPAAATTAAAAALLYASAAQRPTPTQVIELLRQGAGVDTQALTSAPPFTHEHIESLEASIAQLMHPEPQGPAKLDAEGVISLHASWQMLGD